MRLVIACLAITHHSHDKWKRGTGTVVLVRVEEDTKTLEVIGRAKDRTLLCALLGEPQGESIAMQITLSVDFEFEFNLTSISAQFLIIPACKADSPPSLLRSMEPAKTPILVATAGPR